MLTISKEPPAPDALLDWLATVPGFIQGGTTIDDEPTRLYPYQIAFAQTGSRFRGALKCRQSGFSFICAAEGLAKAHLKPDHTAIFVSYNLDDAKEKIRHADLLFESMPLGWKRRRVTDNKTELEFEDGRGHRSRLVSLPCREPRGKGKADVYLDEMPFMRNSDRIYTAAVPIISRGGGTLTIGSTPLSKQDLFYAIMVGEAEHYPQFVRFTIPWWECREFCTDVEAATADAARLSTDERVARYGTETIRQVRTSLDLQSFQQEYECAFVDDHVAYLPWDLIVACAKDSDELPVAATVQEFLSTRTQGPLSAGYDVGRVRNAAELIVVELVGGRQRVRLMQTLPQSEFSLQRETLSQLLSKRADVRRLCIDATGLGMQLGEELNKRFRERAEPVTFTNPVKLELGTTLKIAMEERNLHIPAQRDIMLQLHSVRKTVTVAGNIRLDTEHDETHHADKFWALALALHAAKQPAVRPFTGAAGPTRDLLAGYVP